MRMTAAGVLKLDMPCRCSAQQRSSPLRWTRQHHVCGGQRGRKTAHDVVGERRRHVGLLRPVARPGEQVALAAVSGDRRLRICRILINMAFIERPADTKKCLAGCSLLQLAGERQECL